MSLVDKNKCINFLHSSTRIILLNLGILNIFQTTVPKHVGQLGYLDFGSYKPLEDPIYIFSATVIEIIDSGKRVFTFCDVESYHYTLIEVERFSIIQVQTNDEHTSTCTDNYGDYNDDRDDYFNLKSYTSSSDSTSSD